MVLDTFMIFEEIGSSHFHEQLSYFVFRKDLALTRTEVHPIAYFVSNNLAQ